MQSVEATSVLVLVDFTARKTLGQQVLRRAIRCLGCGGYQVPADHGDDHPDNC